MPLNSDVIHLMHAFEQIARPVLFRHDDESFPYWGKGSSMLLADAQQVYWLTAAHVIANVGGTLAALRICPSDESRVSLPFNQSSSIVTVLSEDHEYRDILALRINLAEFDLSGDSPLAAQDVQSGLFNAENLSLGSELRIIGYPAEHLHIDYEAGRINSTRSVVRAVYVGPSESDHCHVARVETSLAFESFDGLSGSPIFYMQSRSIQGEVVEFPLIVGMLLRGTASSGLVRFVSASVLADFLRLAAGPSRDV